VIYERATFDSSSTELPLPLLGLMRLFVSLLNLGWLTCYGGLGLGLGENFINLSLPFDPLRTVITFWPC